MAVRPISLLLGASPMINDAWEDFDAHLWSILDSLARIAVCQHRGSVEWTFEMMNVAEKFSRSPLLDHINSYGEHLMKMCLNSFTNDVG